MIARNRGVRCWENWDGGIFIIHRMVYGGISELTPPVVFSTTLLLSPSSDCSPPTHVYTFISIQMALKLPGSPSLLSYKVPSCCLPQHPGYSESTQMQQRVCQFCHPFPNLTLVVQVFLHSVNDPVAFTAPGSQ